MDVGRFLNHSIEDLGYWLFVCMLLPSPSFDILNLANHPNVVCLTTAAMSALVRCITLCVVGALGFREKDETQTPWWLMKKIWRNKEKVDKKGNSILHYAVANGDKDFVDKLIQEGANVNAQNKIGWSVVAEASNTEHLDIMMELIKAKADVNLQRSDGMTPLHMCAGKGKWEFVQALLDAKAEVNTKYDGDKTPLMSAARNGNLKIVKALLKANADVKARAVHGTALHESVTNSGLEVVNALIDAKGDLNAQNFEGETPLWLAARFDKYKKAEALIKAKADVNAKDHSKTSPLSIAKGHYFMERLLKRNGATE